MQSVLSFVKKNIVMVVAFAAAFFTALFVPPDKGYLYYFDVKTLTCLFCTLSVICALQNIHFFQIVARKIVRIFRNTRAVVLALVYITFLGSMLIANDMALLTFLPLGYFVVMGSGQRKLLSFTFIMQTISANLGGMLTPFGNPQNLYLYSYFHIPNLDFIKIMLFPFLLSVLLITLCCILFVKKEPLPDQEEREEKLQFGRTVIYLLLFAFSIAIVLRVVSYYWGLIVIPLALFFLDRQALKDVDYPLLLTFCAFFVFSGNLARIPAVHGFLSYLMEKNTLLFGVLSCQVISNVPSAVLLSKFTENYSRLLVAVNIGGVGTLISSLASLITFKEYCRRVSGKAMAYIREYSLYNFSFVIILVVVMGFVFK